MSLTVLPRGQRGAFVTRHTRLVEIHHGADIAAVRCMKPTRRPLQRVQRCILLTLAATAWTVAPAQAQWVVAPYLGINLAGDAEFRRGGPAVSVAFFGEHLGFGFDVERHNHFFKDKDVLRVLT